MQLRLALFAVLLILSACGRTYLDNDKDDDETPPDATVVVIPPDASIPPQPARTTLEPPPGPFNGSVEVTFTTDKPATVYFTTDGSDPKQSPTVQAKPAPFHLTFDQTTTLALFSKTEDGAREDARSVMYVRAGGPKGTVSGVVVLGELAAGNEIAVAADLGTLPLGLVAQKGEVPFTVTDLTTGTHRLQAIADTNQDGQFIPFLDLDGTPYGFDLDLNDPFRASLEGVRLYIAASQPGLCTLKGTVSFPVPIANQNLSVAALDPALLQGGAGTDPQTLLTAFSNGYRVTTNDTDKSYTYLITDLTPSMYMPVPALIGAGAGISLNLLVDLSSAKDCAADEVVVADFAYGRTALDGTITYTPATPAFFGWGAVAVRNLTFGMGGIKAQLILMPTLLLPGADGTLGGTFAAVALKDNATFDVRAFTSLDASATGNPVTDALAWAMNPFSPTPPQATFTSKPPTQSVELKVP
ncbi:MAG: chitobiase/beta-hexosaminidase C-terminal domain-containing protein [Myxococcales bacterium]